MTSERSRRGTSPPGKQRNRRHLVVVVPIVLVLLLVVGAIALRPGAPRRVVIATGGASSTFFRFGQAYAGLSTPVSYSARLYTLRAHVELVRAKLEASRPGARPARDAAARLAAGVDPP